MRAVGVEPPVDTPYARPQRDGAQPEVADPSLAPPGDVVERVSAVPPEPAGGEPAAAAQDGAAPPGTPLPSRPLKRIGTTPGGPSPEPKPLLTPVDSGRPRRLSRTRRAPSAPARWAVRVLTLLVLVAVVVVLAILLASLV